jgi:hypothetical protein
MRPLRTILMIAGMTTPVLLPVPRGEAQQVRRIVVTPYAGVFMPSAKVAELRSINAGLPAAIGIRQQSSLAMGMGASYWFNDFAGLELGGAWAFSDAVPSPALSGEVPGLSPTRNESARVVMGSAKFMVNLFRLNQRSAVRLGVGPAIINRGGAAYDADSNGEFTGLTDIGGVVSLCTRLPLTDFLSLRVRAENYLYSTGLAYRSAAVPSEQFSFRSRTQNDFIFSAGLQMVWRR